MALIDDGRTLILAETLRLQLTAFDVASDGTLSNRRVWASTAPREWSRRMGSAPTLGAASGIAALGNAVVRYAERQRVTSQVETSQIA